ncbi:DUF4153 domain-containing protein [Cupriavidus pampae]|uniref:DUF4153 domain-containing protein n=1 Tax=Cupriavidus pampae TaxID=659251 RepID=A0ABM8XY49_9BURK|nr:DUF4153 domain-containing protein [Cupriavidus pampae]CAG9185328.1 hypothetical protein LMG32289_05917 [Cupriavidus pampae]
MHMMMAGSATREARQRERALFMGRVLVGAGQGILLYSLYRAAQDHSTLARDYVFAPMLLAALMIPPMAILGFSQLRAPRLVFWCVLLAAVVAMLGYHDAWRHIDPAGIELARARYPSAHVAFIAATIMFIAYAIVVAADTAGTYVAPYPAYFRISWKLGIQGHLAALFAAVLYLVLWIGAELFELLGLRFLETLLRQAWFNIPVLTMAFAAGLHITDVRDEFVRGVRTLVLTLLSWVLPLLVLLLLGFLLTLAFKGLAPLWATRSAASLLLGAAALLVVLINAVYKSGLAEGPVPRLLRSATSLACLILVPLVIIAGYALLLRIQQYGLTERRVLTAAALLLAACYAVGYAWAALERNAGLLRIASTNVLTACLTVVVLVALYTPVADPARLSVNSQVARLHAGRIAPDKFDFHYLKTNAGRYGREALAQLVSQPVTQTDGPNAAAIRLHAANASRPPASTELPDAAAIASLIDQRTPERPVPPSFFSNAWGDAAARQWLPGCLMARTKRCDAFVVDFLPGAGGNVVLMETNRQDAQVFAQDADGVWRRAARFHVRPECADAVRESMTKGTYAQVPPPLPQIDMGDQFVRLLPAETGPAPCRASAPPPSAKPASEVGG